MVARNGLLLVVACLGSWCSNGTAVRAADLSEHTPEEMARWIDEQLAERWGAASIRPAPRAGDSQFLRRLSLDLTGIVPRVSDVRQFCDEPRGDKRSLLIDRLLQSSAHANYMAIRWRDIMLPDGFSSGDLASAAGLQLWFRNQFIDNLRYDRIVSDFLVATGGGVSGPALFYTSLDVKPERLAASTSRIFLGLQMGCAQCHDHPFDDWTQEDFWGYAAFFAQLRQTRSRGGMPGRLEESPRGEVTLPETNRVILPRYPSGEAARSTDGGTRRMQLAIWMASRDNPYLARAAVNRAWAHLFGRGLVEPVDDLGPHNPPSHPRLLAMLEDYFTRHNFDLRLLYRTLALTEAYQRSSQTVNDPPAPAELYHRMAIKPLTADQLYDSIHRVLVRRRGTSTPAAAQRLFDPRRRDFVARMRSMSRSNSEFDRGIPQALTLMNGLEVVEATDLERSALLGSLEAPFFTTQEKIDILFLATLSRPPTDRERNLALNRIVPARKSVPPESNDASLQMSETQVLSDMLWAILNSAEFTMNH